jgi:hypothetical protein
MPLDPTHSESRRAGWERTFNDRWRDLRGDVRSLLEGGGRFVQGNGSHVRGNDHYYPRNDDVANGEQIADFRDWFENRLYRDVVEPVPRFQQKSGVHYTAAFVNEMYRHGLRLAHADARETEGIELDDDREGVVGQADNHEARRREWFTTAYNYLEDAARDTEKEVTREYQRAVSEGWSVDETITAINGDNSGRTKGRIPGTGENRTRLLAHSVGVQIINDAILERATDLGIEEVGVEPEHVDEDQLAALGHRLDHPPEDEEQLSDEWYSWETAGDNRVCPECADLEGNRYLISDIRDGSAPMPVRDTHLGCRCRLSFIGRVQSDNEQRRRVGAR